MTAEHDLDTEARGNEHGSRPIRRRVGRLGAFVVGAVAASLITGTVAFAAGKTFTDVPPGHPFATEIGKVAGACIAGGYNDGTYRPSDPVTRQAMAAFLSRSGSAVFEGVANFGGDSLSAGSNIKEYSGWVNPASVTVTIPDLPGTCNVPVTITGNVDVRIASTQTGACKTTNTCLATTKIFNGEVEMTNASTFRFTSDAAGGTLNITEVTSQPDGTTRTYNLRLQSRNVKLGFAVVDHRAIAAVVNPFGTPIP